MFHPRDAALSETETARQRAERLDYPLVAITNFELLRILAGHPIVCGTADGASVLVYLPNPTELLALAEKAGDRLEAEGLHRGPGMDRVKAVELTTPLDVDALLDLLGQVEDERDRAQALADRYAIEVEDRNKMIKSAIVALRARNHE
jgi:hypothetical protein